MAGIRESLLRLFNIDISEWAAYSAKKKAGVSETGDSFNIHIELQPERMPGEEAIRTFLTQIQDWDTAELTLQNVTREDIEGSYLSIYKVPDADKYRKFIALFKKKQHISVDLIINKGISENGIRSVYEWEAFAECICSNPEEKNPEERNPEEKNPEEKNPEEKSLPGFLQNYLNDIFNEHPEGINFLVLDQEADFATESLSFVNSADNLVHMKGRGTVLERYNGASLYMGRTNDRLLPGDFHANAARSSLPGPSGQAVKELFKKYETLYSLIYLADASWFEDKALVVQLKKGGIQYRLPSAEIKNNANIYELTDWVFDGENSVERAEIARDILAAHCRNTEDILSIEGGIKESARSSYKLFSQKAVDQYIAVKRDLIKSIFESTKQIQDLMGTLADTLGKNFVAVITVVISQVLTQNIYMEKWGTEEFLNKEFKIVVAIYFVASLAYLFATLHTVYTKWQSYKERYDMIRDQYKGLLYKDELDKAFDNDRLITKSKSEVFWYSCIISVLWIFMITLILMIALEANIWQIGIAVLIFAGLCAWAYKNYKDEKAPLMRLGDGRKKEQDR